MTHTEIVTKFFQVALDIHHNHLNTTLYSEHIALKEAYQAFDEFKDTIAESLIAFEGPIDKLEFDEVGLCKTLDLPDDMMEAASMLKEYAAKKNYPDLVNFSDEVYAAGVKLKYLLRLT